MAEASQCKKGLVASEHQMAGALCEQIAMHNIHCENAHTVTDALSLASKRCFDVLVFDDALPEINLVSFCARIHDMNVGAPILLLTEQTSHESALQIIAHNQADDYLVKPFRLHAFLVRVQQLLKTPKALGKDIVTIGQYHLYPRRKVLKNTATDKTITLTEKETAVLMCLHKAKGEMVSREEMLRDVWGYDTVINTHTLETHIYRLRQKMGNEGHHQADILVTTPGGYRLVI